MIKSSQNITVAISTDFLKSFSRIPKTQQVKVSKFINEFKANPTASSINYEKINAAKDKSIRSIRIDHAYRGIVLKPDTGNVFLLLYVANHDDAYNWVKNKIFPINPHTGGVQVLDITSENLPEAKEPVPINEPCMFDKIKDKHLLRLAIPELLLPLVRNIKTEGDLDKAQDYLPQEASDALYLLAMGYSYEETYNELDKTSSENIDINDYKTALANPDTLARFCIVEDDEELMSLLDAPLEQWRTFLHPSQRSLVESNFNGPLRVLGGAGTGKTVVAMHRAKWLARNIFTLDGSKILFTTFTKNLADDIRDQLKKICPTELLKRIEVKHINAWVHHFLISQNYEYDITYIGDEMDEYWDSAINNAESEDLSFSREFYKDEWNHVLQAQGILWEKEYLRASRVGRGTRLNRNIRKLIWPVFEEYRSLLNSKNKKEFIDAVRDARAILKSKGNILPYNSVIVDEAQDMPAEVFKLLRQIVPVDYSKDTEDVKATGNLNDIFIVGDAHQRIYAHKVTLGKCGINIRGRGKRLKVNYRTTEETRNWAISLLKGISIDDLDGELDSAKGYRSLTHGPAPQIKTFNTFAEEIDFIKQQLQSFTANNIPLESICLLARTSNELRQYEGALKASSIETYKIKYNAVDNQKIKGLRIATMHRVKGLEFDYIHIASVNDGIIPLENHPIDDNNKARKDFDTRERALLYVAATRARKGLILTSYGKTSKYLLFK